VLPNTGGNGVGTNTTNDGRGIIAVGINGVIFATIISGLSGIQYNNFRPESSGTLQNLYAVYANAYDNITSQNYVAICVGGSGTVLKSARRGPTTGSAPVGTWTSKSIYDFDGTTQLLNDLYAVAGDNSASTVTSKWVAVGAAGVIVTSSDNGENWTRRVSNTGVNLYGVKFGNGYWVAVGNNGVILRSTDMITWTQINIGLTIRNLHTIDYSPFHNRFNIGGDGQILTSPSVPNFSSAMAMGADETYSLTRLWYRGSNELTNNNTPQPVQGQLVNGQTVSGVLIDTDYVAGQETTYYLVVGNMASSTVYAAGPWIGVTEYKR
jgi:hypothetical protein